MIAYFDASAFVKLFKREPGSDDVREIWTDADALVTSQLTYPEARSAIRRGLRAGKVPKDRYLRAVNDLDRFWSELLAPDVDAWIAASAGQLADLYELSGADAVHLATGLRSAGEDFVFVTWDRRLSDSAVALGLQVVPASI